MEEISAAFSSQSAEEGMSDREMFPTYDRLANRLKSHVDAGNSKQYWVACAGGPGSGKSTLAAAVADRLNSFTGHKSCVVLPLDGFHYSKAKLKELDPPDASDYMARRGAPWTFDAESFVQTLTAAKEKGSGSLPSYSREISDPLPNGVDLRSSHKVVIVEGNYVLSNNDPRWRPLDSLWDEKWFIKCTDRNEQRGRLVKRSLKTWSAAKAEVWGQGEEGAAARVDANDVKNMDIIADSEQFADLVIESL